MDQEIISIDQLRKETLLKALNKSGTIGGAATLMGISERTALRWKRSYHIRKDPDTGTFFISAPRRIKAIAGCLVAFAAHAQIISGDSNACGIRYWVKPDTLLVIRIISNETPSTWWCHVDHRPFLCKLLLIVQFNEKPRYYKKLSRGWGPLPAYYRIW
jgi:hypothetical protein